MKKTAILAASALACLVVAGSAEAHIGLSPTEAPAGSTVLLGFGVGHGCDGSPTTAVRIRIPEGVISVQPVPKAGWQIAITNGTYATPHQNGDAAVTDGVTEIDWTGGNLPNEYYDQFFLRFRLADDVQPGTTVWFPVVQECTDGVDRWITVPVEGQPEPDEPTPGLAVTAPVAEQGS